MAGFSESSTVQAWLVQRLVGLGWDHVPGDFGKWLPSAKSVPRESTDVLVQEWLLGVL